MFSSLCEKLPPKMGNIFRKYKRNLRALVQRWVGGLSEKRIRAYRVGGLVKNVMILSVRTLWMTPYQRLGKLLALPPLGIVGRQGSALTPFHPHSQSENGIVGGCRWKHLTGTLQEMQLYRL